MKKHAKRWMALLMMMVCLVGVFPSQRVYAAQKDVTETMAANKKINAVVEMINGYVCVELAENHSTATTKEKMSGYNLLSMAAYVGYDSFWISQYTKKEIQTLTYNLFGKKPSVSTIPTIYSSSRKWLAKKFASYQTKPYAYCGGDWGDYVPGYKILKVVKVKSGVYNVTFRNKLQCYERGTKNLGKTTIQIKKTSKSEYGYIITSITYKGTGIGYW